MRRSARLCRDPQVFRALTGLTVPEFAALLREAVPALAAADRARLSRPARRRAIGAGHPTALGPRDQLRQTVGWLRRDPTDVVLGYLFGVDEATVRRPRSRVLPVRETLGRDTMRLPDPGKYRRPTLDVLLADTPGLAVIVDTFEPPLQRPKDRGVAATYYRGKKKRPTRKTQVAIEEQAGRCVDVAAGVRGPTADLTRLKDAGLLARLPPQVGALGDLADVGLAGLHPTGWGATPRRKPRGQERPPDDIADNTAFARRRVAVAHSIRRRRVSECLTQTDRHHQRHSDACAVTCAGLVNRPIAARRAVARAHPDGVSAAPSRPAVARLEPVAVVEPTAA